MSGRRQDAFVGAGCRSLRASTLLDFRTGASPPGFSELSEPVPATSAGSGSDIAAASARTGRGGAALALAPDLRCPELLVGDAAADMT